MTINHYIETLSESTSELLRRYGEFDADGYLKSFYIINEEIIGAICNAGRWLQEGFWANEKLSEVWDESTPCESCPEREGCSITCRRKHNFDKAVYGDLLCGRKPVAYRLLGDSDKIENKVRFKVRLEGENALVFTRDTIHLVGAVQIRANGAIVIERKELFLSPWSAALYQMFVRHPEGFPLAFLSSSLKEEFVELYKTISGSVVKVKRMRQQLASPRLSHILNNKLSELNIQLRGAGIREDFIPRTEKYKSNNKPYFIPYLWEQNKVR